MANIGGIEGWNVLIEVADGSTRIPVLMASLQLVSLAHLVRLALYCPEEAEHDQAYASPA